MKSRTKTKALSWLISLALLLGLMPGLSLPAHAAEESEYFAVDQGGYNDDNDYEGTHFHIHASSPVDDGFWIGGDWGDYADVISNNGKIITKVEFAGAGSLLGEPSCGYVTDDGWTATVNDVNDTSVRVYGVNGDMTKIYGVRVYYAAQESETPSSGGEDFEPFSTNQGCTEYTGMLFRIRVYDEGSDDGFTLGCYGDFCTVESLYGDVITKVEFQSGWFDISRLTAEKGTVTFNGDVATVSDVNDTSLTVNASDILRIKAVKVYYKSDQNDEPTDVIVDNISYLDENGETQIKDGVMQFASQTECKDGWYVVNSDVTVTDRITLSGTVNLILADGKTLTAAAGINTGGATLNIYGQSGGTGKLIATGGEDAAAIGGREGYTSPECDGGTVTINGGTIKATGGDCAAGIGGGTDGTSGTITINGGTIEATGGGYAAGIGGSYSGGVDTITINGGTIKATGGNHAAGIGSGNSYDNGGTIVINGGMIEARGSDDAAAIGDGVRDPWWSGDPSTVTIVENYILIAGSYPGNYVKLQASFTIPTDFASWTASNALPSEAGNYKLDKDVTLGSTWTAPAGVTYLDLNGHGIKMTGTGSAIDVGNGSMLTVIDNEKSTTHKYTISDPDATSGAGLATVNDALSGSFETFKGGYITGGNDANDYGGAIDVSGGTLNVLNCTLIGNAAFNGGAVSVGKNGTSGKASFDGTAFIGNMGNDSQGYGGAIYVTYNSNVLKLKSCTITKNKAAFGGAVANLVAPISIEDSSITYNSCNVNIGGLFSSSSDANCPSDVTIKGNVQINHNYSSTYSNNLFLGDNANVVVDGVNAQTSIAVVKYGEGVFTRSSVTDKAKNYLYCFTCDNGYNVVPDGDELKLSTETYTHTHNLTYSDSGATITATCANEDGYCLLDDGTQQHNHSATLTVVAPALTKYGETGKSAEATIDGGIAGEENPSIVYKKDGVTLDAAPTNAGTYTANITMGGATASVEYTIAKANPTVTAPTGLTGVFGKLLADVVLFNPDGNTPGTWEWANPNTFLHNGGTHSFKANFTPQDTANYNIKTDLYVQVLIPVFVTSFILDKTEASVLANKSVTLTPSFKPAETTNRDVIWSSNNPAIATVSETGVVTGHAEGTAIITATATNNTETTEDDLTATCTVTVQASSYTFTVPKTVALRKTYNGLFVSVDGGEEVAVSSQNQIPITGFTVSGKLMSDSSTKDVLKVRFASANVNDGDFYLKPKNGEGLLYRMSNYYNEEQIEQLNETAQPLSEGMNIFTNLDDQNVGSFTDTVTVTTSIAECNSSGNVISERDQKQYTMEITLTVEADPDVPYRAWNGSTLQQQTLSGVRYRAADFSGTRLDGNWFIAKNDTTINDDFSIYDTVNLIICDGATLTITGRMYAPFSNGSINIYNQGESSKLVINGINVTGSIKIHGGTVEIGNRGMSGGLNVYESNLTVSGNIDNLTMYNSTVNANGGISGNVTINGGTLNATNESGNAIGGAVTLNSGTVNAIGSQNGVNGNVTLVDGTLTAEGGEGGKGIAGRSITVPDEFTVYSDALPNPTTILDSPYTARFRYMVIDKIDLSEAVSYLNADNETAECSGYKPIMTGTTAWNDGWYVVNKSITCNEPVIVSGTVNLIIRDGITLNTAKGITVQDGGKLNIYAQNNGSGKLKVTGNSGSALNGTVNLYGGSINAIGTVNGAGVEGNLTVYHGIVNATGAGSGDGVKGAVTVHIGEINAESTNGDGISGSTLTVEDSLVTAKGKNGISSETVNVTVGTIKATATDGNGVSGALTIGNDRMLQGGTSADSMNPIEIGEKKAYMQVSECVYTIFYQDNNEWTIPCCTYTWDGGSETLEMTRDGSFWRATAYHLPTDVTFFDADTEATTGTQSVSEISTVRIDNPTQPAGTDISGYGKYFVIAGGCRVITFVDYDNTSKAVMVADGGLVERPEDPVREDHYFRGWASGHYYQYGIRQNIYFDFNRPVKSSATVYAEYSPNKYPVEHFIAYWGGLSVGAAEYGSSIAGRLDPPEAKTSSDIFQGWYLVNSARVLNSQTNEIEMLAAGEKFDLDLYRIAGKITLKPEWKHEHTYDMMQYSYYYENYSPKESWQYVYSNANTIGMHNSSHVLICNTCKAIKFEPHSFDADGKCKCGFDASQITEVYPVSFVVQDENGRIELTSSNTVRKAGTYAAFPHYIGDGVFMSYQIYDVTDPENPVLKQVEHNSNMSAFVITSPTMIVKVHRSRWQRFPESSVELKTSKNGGNDANLQVNWSLSTGSSFVSAGILTTTNNELQKYSYSTFGGKKTLDTSNLLKSNQRGGYDNDLRDQMKNRIVNGESYDPNVNAVIHDFHANNKASSGSYMVSHQLPTGETANKYGQWVYVVGYVIYYDTAGELHKLYTKPVAVSTSDVAHTEKYIRGDIM